MMMHCVYYCSLKLATSGATKSFIFATDQSFSQRFFFGRPVWDPT